MGQWNDILLAGDLTAAVSDLDRDECIFIFFPWRGSKTNWIVVKCLYLFVEMDGAGLEIVFGISGEGWANARGAAQILLQNDLLPGKGRHRYMPRWRWLVRARLQKHHHSDNSDPIAALAYLEVNPRNKQSNYLAIPQNLHGTMLPRLVVDRLQTHWISLDLTLHPALGKEKGLEFHRAE